MLLHFLNVVVIVPIVPFVSIVPVVARVDVAALKQVKNCRLAQAIVQTVATAF